MSKKIDLIRIFVVGPEDVEEERQALAKVVQELNITLGDTSNVRLELLAKSHVAPNIGAYPQAVINEQIGEDYDIFVGVLWKTFGTPTPRADSGTVGRVQAFLRQVPRRPGSNACDVLL